MRLPCNVYVHSFHVPLGGPLHILALGEVQRARLWQDLERLVTHLSETLPKAFRQEAFEKEQRELGEKYEPEMRQLQETFGRMARDNGFGIQADASGDVAFIPLHGDRAMTPEELERLSEEERQDLERRQNQIVVEFRSVMLRQRQIMQQLKAEIREVERNFSAMLIAVLMAELKQRHPQKSVGRFLDAIQEDMLSKFGTLNYNLNEEESDLQTRITLQRHFISPSVSRRFLCER